MERTAGDPARESRADPRQPGRWGALAAALGIAFLVGRASVGESAIDVPLPSGLEQARPEFRARVERAVAVVRASPEDARAWIELGMVYEASGRWETAVAAYERAAALAPDDASVALRAVEAARFHEGEDAYEARLRTFVAAHPDSAPGLYQLGELLLRSGAFDEAEALFRRLLATRRFVPDAHCALGRVALQRGDATAALDELEQAIELAPDYLEARRQRGLALVRLGREQEARSDLALVIPESARGVVPDALSERVPLFGVDLNDLVLHSQQFLRSGRVSLAVAAAEAAHELQPEDPRACAALGAAYLRDARPYLAVDLLETAARGRPGDVGVALDLATAWLVLDVPERALPAAEAAAALEPDRPEPHLARARALRALGRLDEAGETVARVLQLDPGNPAAAQEAAAVTQARVRSARR